MSDRAHHRSSTIHRTGSSRRHSERSSTPGRSTPPATEPRSHLGCPPNGPACTTSVTAPSTCTQAPKRLQRSSGTSQRRRSTWQQGPALAELGAGCRVALAHGYHLQPIAADHRPSVALTRGHSLARRPPRRHRRLRKRHSVVPVDPHHLCDARDGPRFVWMRSAGPLRARPAPELTCAAGSRLTRGRR